MANSDILGLPFIEAAQAQKHVTHNEALRLLDPIVQLTVADRDLTAPPGSPANGDRYIVGASATGAWAGKDNQIAVWQDGAWVFFIPEEGWLSWVKDEDVLVAWSGSAWSVVTSGGSSSTAATSPNGAKIDFAILEEEVTCSGASVDTTIQIPDRAIVFAVSTRTTQAVTGATSYDCGIAGEAGKFGATLGIALGSTNSGVIGPAPFYAATPVRLTANGANFTGGKVRVAIQYLTCPVPAS